jgi:D-amino-acid dehydrogenase
MPVDAQIIGGGLIGLSTAYALQKRGASVRVIDAREGVGLETSFANAGMLHASIAAPWNHPGVGRELLSSFFNPHSAMKLRLSAIPDFLLWGPKFLAASRPGPHWHATRHNYALATASIKKTGEWIRALDMKIDQRRNGLLNIMRSQSDFDDAKSQADKLASLGFQAESFSPAQVVGHEPALAPIERNILGAMYYPGDYSADAYKFCKALASAIDDHGGEIITGVQVSNIIKENGNVIGVRSSNRDFTANTTIIAAGSHTEAILRGVGVKIPLRPVKGYSLTFDGVEGPRSPVIDESLHAAMTPLGNRLRIAGTAEISGFNTNLPKSRLEPLLNMMKSVYPELAKGLSVDQGRPWCGFRPVSADGLPFIGRTSVNGLAVNTGHGHMGWTLSAGSGALLADILDGRDTGLDEWVFDPER